MAKSLETRLAEVTALRELDAGDAVDPLRKALGDRSSHVVAKVAQIVGEAEMQELGAGLAEAFERFMREPVKSDPGCRAKAAIAEALYRMCGPLDAEGWADRVFLPGVVHVQWEPVYGGRVDTATELRGHCAFALVRIDHPEAMDRLADLLADPDPPVRVAAARALAYSDRDDAVPLLRLRIRTGDEAQVLAECFEAMLRLAPRRSLGLVARYLDHDDTATCEAAAVALGQSRLDEAFDLLRAFWDRTLDLELRAAVLLAIAMLRHESPLGFLLSLIREEPAPTAEQALTALAIYRQDDTLRHRVREAVAQRSDTALRDALAAW